MDADIPLTGAVPRRSPATRGALHSAARSSTVNAHAVGEPVFERDCLVFQRLQPHAIEDPRATKPGFGLASGPGPSDVQTASLQRSRNIAEVRAMGHNDPKAPHGGHGDAARLVRSGTRLT